MIQPRRSRRQKRRKQRSLSFLALMGFRPQARIPHLLQIQEARSRALRTLRTRPESRRRLLCPIPSTLRTVSAMIRGSFRHPSPLEPAALPAGLQNTTQSHFPPIHRPQVLIPPFRRKDSSPSRGLP